MRIRRHARTSPSAYGTSFLELPVQTHVCQLNQSPWDAGRFSPPSYSSEAPSLEAADSDHLLHRPPEDSPGKAAAEEVVKSRPSILRCEIWQSQREASKEYSLSDHHLSQVKCKSYSNKSGETENATSARPHRIRQKKAPPKSTSTNPNEFYYYSGFGPRWGKKRTNEKDRSSFDYEHEFYGSLLMSEEFEIDEEEDEDEDQEIGKKKRARKPIKARSLKSLM